MNNWSRAPVLLAVGSFRHPVRLLALPVLMAQLLGSPSQAQTISPASRGMTLYPQETRAGERVRAIAAAPVREVPDTAAPISRMLPRFRIVVVRGDTVAQGLTWIGLAGGGYVDAALLDRLPQPVAGDLEAGREGLVGGRVLPWDYRPSDLRTVPDSIAFPGVGGRTLMLRSEALQALMRLLEASREAGHDLRVVSAWRPADYQADLYTAQWQKDRSQNVSAAPGRSEHQLGTAVDLGPPGRTPLRVEFGATAAGRWLVQHCEEFGFVLSFSRMRHRRRGVAYEPWHVRWVGDGLDETDW